MPEEPVDPTAQELGGRIAEVVARRRAEGRYDGDLEAWMDDAYRRIVGRGRAPSYAEVLAASARLEGQPRFAVPETGASRYPGGAAAHRLVGVALRAHLEPLVGQLNEFADAVRASVHALTEVVAVPRHVIGHLAAMEDRLAEVQRTLNQMASAAAAPPAPPAPPTADP